MKKLLLRAKELAEQADRMGELLASAPERIEHAKRIVTLTTGQLQQIRTEVQSSIAGLRADTGDAVTAAVRELNEGAPTFLRAGYALTGVDMELGIALRVTAHLERVEEVGIRAMRQLLGPNSGQRVIHGILSALVKAQELAESTQFDGMEPTEVSIQVGAAPTVRVRWRTMLREDESHAAVAPPPLLGTGPYESPVPKAATVVTIQPVAAPASPFGQGSFFEPRSTPAAPVRQSSEDTAVPEPTMTASESKSVASVPVSTDPLARFKRMPDLSKPRR